MPSHIRNIYTHSLIIFTACFLTACGGSSGGSGDKNTYQAPGNEVSASEFKVYTQSGVWRTSVNFDFQSAINLDVVGGTYPFDGDILMDATLTTAVDYINDNSIFVENCDAVGAKPYSDGTASGDDFTSLLNGGEAEFLYCDSSLKSRYFIVSDNDYRIGIYCDNKQLGSVNMMRISSTPEFNQGVFTLNSDQFQDLNASNGVCGNSVYVDAELDPRSDAFPDQTITVNSHYILVAAPYGLGKLALELSFPSAATTGTYAVTEYLSDEVSANQVAVTLTSSEFGGDSANPVSIYGVSGSVTITGVSDYQASGNFTIETDTGDSMSGSFNFDIR